LFWDVPSPHQFRAPHWSQMTDPHTNTLVTNDGLQEFARLRGRSLHQIHLSLPSSFSLSQIREFLHTCPSLYEMKFAFAGQSDEETETGSVDISVLRSKITAATLSGLSGENVIAFLPSVGSTLRHLDLDGCHGLLGKIRLVVNLCPNLEVLHLSLCCCKSLH